MNNIIFWLLLLICAFALPYLIVSGKTSVAIIVSLIPILITVIKNDIFVHLITLILTMDVVTRYFNFLPEITIWIVDIVLLVIVLTYSKSILCQKLELEIIFIVLFLSVSLISCILNGSSFIFLLIGLKRALFPFLLIMFLYGIYDRGVKYEKIYKTLYCILLIQPPICLIEFFLLKIYGTNLAGIMWNGYVPAIIDSASGTFGAGGTATLSFFILLSFLFLRFSDKVGDVHLTFIKSTYILSPLLITFSGGAIVALPFVLLTVLAYLERDFVKKLFINMPLAFLLFVLILTISTMFMRQTGATELNSLDVLEYVEYHLSLDRLNAVNDNGFVDKFGSIKLAWNSAKQSDGGILFGSGPGTLSSSVLAGDTATSTQFNKGFTNTELASSSMITRTLGEYGVLGILVIFVYIAIYIYKSYSDFGNNNISKGLFFLLILFAVSSLYVESWMSRQLSVIFAIAILTIKTQIKKGNNRIILDLNITNSLQRRNL